MKTSIKLILLLLLATFVQSCGNDDDNSRPSQPEQEEMEEQEEELASLIGDWDIVSGDFISNQTQYLKVNDNFLNILMEDSNGFRNELRGNFIATDTQITLDLSLSYGGIKIYNYTLTDTTLTLVDSAGNSASFNRLVVPVDAEAWITDITILEQADAPWDESSDIAFNGTHILLGNGYESDDIGLINTSTIALDGVLTTTQSAFAVEVEKYDGPDRYIFQSDNGSSNIRAAYREDTGDLAFTSMELGPWVYGIASIDSESAWASSGNNRELYLYNYGSATGETITTTLALENEARGLDYQNNHLYICTNGKIYKCETSPTFRVLDSFEIEGYSAQGIAFDGTNFWLNARPNTGGTYQIIKTNLTL